MATKQTTNLASNNKCPMCGSIVTVTDNEIYCGSHFSTNGTGILDKLLRLWQPLNLECLLDGAKTELNHDGYLVDLKQTRDGVFVSACGRLEDILGLFGAFKKIHESWKTKERT